MQPLRTSTFSKVVILAVWVTALCGINQAANAAAGKGDVTGSYPVAPGGTLTIEADRGSIDVVTGAGQTVEVKVVRQVKNATPEREAQILTDHKIDVVHQGNDVRIIGKGPRNFLRMGFRNQEQLEVHYSISVPKKYNLELTTAGGSITGPDIEGFVHARTSGGSVKLGKVDGEINSTVAGGSIRIGSGKGKVEAKVSGGQIEIGNVAGDVRAEAAGGSVKIDRASGKATASVSGGTITLGDIGADINANAMGGSVSIKHAGGKVVAKCSGGKVSVDNAEDSVQLSAAGGSVNAGISKRPKGDSKLICSGGTVTLGLAANLDVDINAHASGGNVTSDLPMGGQDRERKNRSQLTGKLNAGGANIEMSAAGGSIHIKKFGEN